MVARTRKNGLSWDDAEDLVQDALLKVMRQGVRSGAPSLAVRAFVALRDRRSERARMAARRAFLDPMPRSALAERDVGVTESGYAVVEICEVLTAIAGADVMKFARLKAQGATEADIAEQPGWSPQRAAAARIRLGRKKAALAAALALSLNRKEER